MRVKRLICSAAIAYRESIGAWRHQQRHEGTSASAASAKTQAGEKIIMAKISSGGVSSAAINVTLAKNKCAPRTCTHRAARRGAIVSIINM